MNGEITNFYGLIDGWDLSHYCFTILIAPCRSTEMVFENFLPMRIAMLSAYTMYNNHSHRVLLWIRPKPGPTAEATECPLPIVLDQRSLQSFSCRCGCNFPDAQHGADPPTNHMPKPMLFSTFYYSLKRSTVRGPSTCRKAPSVICLVVSLHSVCAWPQRAVQFQWTYQVHWPTGFDVRYKTSISLPRYSCPSVSLLSPIWRMIP